jgi:predicted RNA polymerase sigma factor
LLPTVRGDLLETMGRHAEALVELERAVTLTANVRERRLLQSRIARIAQLTSGAG